MSRVVSFEHAAQWPRPSRPHWTSSPQWGQEKAISGPVRARLRRSYTVSRAKPTTVRENLAEVRDAVSEWCGHRSWPPRAPLLLWMVYVSLRHLADPDYSSLLGGLNLGIHEAGHLLFGFLPWDFLTVAGGTL